jgi:type IV secretion system protein VirD4
MIGALLHLALHIPAVIWHLIIAVPRALASVTGLPVWVIYLFLVAAVAWWLCPALPGGRRHKLNRHRSRWTRIRLHLRLRPGPGFATVLELWLRWGRFASFRESGRARPGMTFWQRAGSAESHGTYLGRAQLWHRLWVAVQEHICLIGPPRSGKSGLLSRVILHAPGAVVSTSTKPDMFALTSGIRARRGPVYTFNPQGLGGVPSNVQWNPIDGAADPATAIRRADAFANAVSTDGTDDGTFWATQASDHLRAMFAAGAVAESDMRLVGRWVLGSSAADAVALLASAGFGEWAASLSQLDGPAEKTNATVKMVMRRALAYLGDPSLVSATSPAPGENFDIDKFLLEGGTLYMIAKGDGSDATLGPLFAALASEIQFRATQLGSRMPGGRLDPPLLMALDECTQICPVPLPQWLADSGGQGVQIVSAFHGVAQLRSRWKDSGAQAILDTSGCKILYPGLSDAETLRAFTGLTGTFALSGRAKDSDSERHEEVATPEMIRRLPPGYGLLMRGGNAPVIARLARGWKDRAYKQARRAGTAVVALQAAAAIPALQVQDFALLTDAEIAGELGEATANLAGDFTAEPEPVPASTATDTPWS